MPRCSERIDKLKLVVVNRHLNARRTISTRLTGAADEFATIAQVGACGRAQSGLGLLRRASALGRRSPQPDGRFVILYSPAAVAFVSEIVPRGAGR